MPRVKIYVTKLCAYCVVAKRLLHKKGIEFEEISVDGDHEARKWLAEVTGRYTVPQIFIDDQPYGGYDDLAAMDRRGELDSLLGLTEKR